MRSVADKNNTVVFGQILQPGTGLERVRIDIVNDLENFTNQWIPVLESR